MSSQTAIAASASDLADNGNPWANVSNATAEDGATASASMPLGPTNTLRLTMGANAFSTTSNLAGVQVDVRCSQPGGGTTTFSLLRLTQGGATLGTDQSATTAVPTTLGYVTFGGPANLMGAGSISSATANLNSFGVDLQFSGGAADSVNVDDAKLTVTFSGGATESSELIAARICVCG